jgi:ActR/RegA family two-component response regulator
MPLPRQPDTAMRHKTPDAITLLFTGFPALKEAMDAILLQADEILVKPMPIPEMVALIRERLLLGGRCIHPSASASRRVNIRVLFSTGSEEPVTISTSSRRMAMIVRVPMSVHRHCQPPQ